jgi:hypothetical protein
MDNRWFMDAEFAENGSTIKLISIALVSSSGDEYYRELSDGWTTAANGFASTCSPSLGIPCIAARR